MACGCRVTIPYRTVLNVLAQDGGAVLFSLLLKSYHLPLLSSLFFLRLLLIPPLSPRSLSDLQSTSEVTAAMAWLCDILTPSDVTSSTCWALLSSATHPRLWFFLFREDFCSLPCLHHHPGGFRDQR